jgi:hypothetical protein
VGFFFEAGGKSSTGEFTFPELPQSPNSGNVDDPYRFETDADDQAD